MYRLWSCIRAMRKAFGTPCPLESFLVQCLAAQALSGAFAPPTHRGLYIYVPLRFGGRDKMSFGMTDRRKGESRVGCSSHIRSACRSARLRFCRAFRRSWYLELLVCLMTPWRRCFVFKNVEKALLPVGRGVVASARMKMTDTRGGGEEASGRVRV